MSQRLSRGDFDRDQTELRSHVPGDRGRRSTTSNAGGEESAGPCSRRSPDAPYSALPTAYLYKQTGTPRPAKLRLQSGEELLHHRRQAAGSDSKADRSEAATARSGAPEGSIATFGRKPRRRSGCIRPATTTLPPSGETQGQGRRASVPSRPRSGNRSASSGPEASPVSASLSGMNSALPLRPVVSLTCVGPGLPGRRGPTARPAAGRRPRATNSRSSSDSSNRPSGPVAHDRHHSCASASFSRLPRTASQNGSACSPATPSASSRSRASANGICVQQRAVEHDEFGGIEFGRRLRGRGQIEALGQIGHRRHGGDVFRGADQHRQRGHRHRLDAGFAQAGDRQRAGALRQPFAGGGGQQIVVAEGRRLGAERLEQRDLHAGIGDMVVAADDMGDAQVDVVDDRRQRVEIGAVLAHQHRVGQRGEVDGLVAAHDDRSSGLPCAPARTGRRAKFGSRKRQCGLRPSASSSAFSASVSFSASRP